MLRDISYPSKHDQSDSNSPRGMEHKGFIGDGVRVLFVVERNRGTQTHGNPALEG